MLAGSHLDDVLSFTVERVFLALQPDNRPVWKRDQSCVVVSDATRITYISSLIVSPRSVAHA